MPLGAVTQRKRSRRHGPLPAGSFPAKSAVRPIARRTLLVGHSCPQCLCPSPILVRDLATALSLNFGIQVKRRTVSSAQARLLRPVIGHWWKRCPRRLVRAGERCYLEELNGLAQLRWLQDSRGLQPSRREPPAQAVSFRCGAAHRRSFDSQGSDKQGSAGADAPVRLLLSGRTSLEAARLGSFLRGAPCCGPH